MASKWIHFVLFAVLLYISGATEENDIENANDYIDTVLDNLRKQPEILKYLDPLSVRDLHDSQYSLKNIRVIGLSTLQRLGDCTLSYHSNTVNVVAEVVVSNGRVLSDYSIKAIFFWINGDFEIVVDHLAAKLDLSITNRNASLNSFKVVNLGNYYVKSITGPSLLWNWLFTPLANRAVQGARENIIEALENGTKDALDNVLKQYKLPIY